LFAPLYGLTLTLGENVSIGTGSQDLLYTKRRRTKPEVIALKWNVYVPPAPISFEPGSYVESTNGRIKLSVSATTHW